MVQAEDGAGLDGGEADGAAAEEGIAVEVAGGAEKVILLDESVGEGDAEAFGGLHAERVPEVAVEDEVWLDVGRLHAGQGHLPAGVGELGGDDGPLDEGGTGGEGLVSGEAELRAGGIEAKEFGGAGVPDAEEEAGAGIGGGAVKLRGSAEGGDEDEGVDVAFVEAAEGEVGAADEGEDAKQGEVLAGFGAEAEAAVRAGQRRGEEAEGAELLEVGDGGGGG